MHKKTTKYCLILQGKISNSEIEKKEVHPFECELCNKEFSYKHVLINHYKSCKGNLIIKNNEILLLKEKIANLEKEKLFMEFENKNLNILLEQEKEKVKEEKQRVNDLINKSKGNTTNNIQTNINTKCKDNFDELFEKLPKFTQENLINSFKEVLNEDIFLDGIDSFTKVINRYLGHYGIVSDFSRHKIIIKDKDGNQVNTISPKVFIDSINNIEEITKEVLAKSREKVDTFAILDQDVYINNLYPIKELILSCENEQTSDKNIMKYGKKLTDNCQVVTRTNVIETTLIGPQGVSIDSNE
jgi:hypothetical protein